MSAQKQEGNKYDKILKENIEEVILPLVGKYLGLDIIKTEKLEAKLQTTIEKETDLLRSSPRKTANDVSYT